jgi:HEAT repeat protein
MLLAETDFKAMFTLANSCSIKSNYLRTCLLKFLSQKDRPYRAQAAALESLANQRHVEDFEFIMSIAKDPHRIGQHALIRSGAIRALGQIRSVEAFDFLMHLLVNPLLTPERSRPFILTSLASCAQWLSVNHVKIATETLVMYLSDELETMRWRAVLGLAKLEAKSAVNRIAASEPLWDAREFFAVKEKIREIKESVSVGIGMAPMKMKEVLKRMEELETRLKQLEANSDLQKQLEANSDLQKQFEATTLEKNLKNSKFSF